MDAKKIKQILLPERDFWKQVIRFGTSIALQNLTVALFGMIDVSIISDMGETAVSAVSLANQVFYVASLINFGITSGASVILSRHYGASDAEGLRKVFTVTVFLCTTINLLIMVASLGLPRQLVALYTDDPVLIAEGAVYLIITALMNPMYGISCSMSSFFRSVNRPTVPLIVSMTTVALKTGLNMIFIYGFGAIPAMGVAGAAVATLLCKLAEMLLYIGFYIALKEKQYCFRMSDLVWIKGKNISVFLKETLPVILNESLWGIGLSSFNMVFGRMGVVAVSAMSIAGQMEKLGNACFYGVSIGACVTISSMLGRKEVERAKLAAKRYAVIGIEVGIAIMVLMLGFNHLCVTSFFGELTEETQQTAEWLIVVYAVYMPFRSLASCLIMGSMRAGGDSKRAMYYDVLPVYLWSLPVGFLLGVWLKLPVVAVLAVMQFKRVIKCGFALRRLISGKWLQIGQE